jgi:O-antigen/teichoic acid export membrane protein
MTEFWEFLDWTRLQKMQELARGISNFKFLKKYFKKGGFVFNVGTMMAGNLSAQLVGILLAPIITRLYLPEHFGIVAVIFSIVAVLSVISCMRYEMAVVLPKTQKEAQNLIALCLALILLVSLVSLLTIPFVNEWVETVTQVKGISIFLYFVPLGILVRGLEMAFRFWFTREKKFPFIAKTRMIIPLSTNGIKIAAGLLVGSSVIWLIIGNIIGVSIVAAIFAVAFLQNNYQRFINSIKWQEIRVVAREYDSFPKYNSFTALMNTLSQNLPAFLFAYYFPFEFVGFYALAGRVLKKPVQLVSNSIRNVFLQRVAEIQNKGRSPRSSFIKTTMVLVVAGMIPFGILTISGEWIFSIVFGTKWATAGYYAKFLCPWLFCLFINPPALTIITVNQKLFQLMVFNVLLLLFRGIAIVLGYHILPDPWVAVALFSSVGVIYNVLLILYAFKLTGTINLVGTKQSNVKA